MDVLQYLTFRSTVCTSIFIKRQLDPLWENSHLGCLFQNSVHQVLLLGLGEFFGDCSCVQNLLLSLSPTGEGESGVLLAREFSLKTLDG